MKKLCLLSFICLCFHQLTIAQMPVLKANDKVLSIKDGEQFRQDYWTISPEIKLDVYQANKTHQTKYVTYYSDIDSIRFEIKPQDQYDFLVLLNGTDSCFQRVESGLTFQANADIKYTTDTLPFTLTAANNISIRGIINQHDTVDLMFHTAANSVSVIEDAREKTPSMQWGQRIDGGNAWGGSGSFRISQSNTLQIGDFTWEKVRIHESKYSGPNTDGKFGPHLFQDKVIEINFEQKQMIIHSLPPEIDQAYEKLELQFDGNNLFVDGTSSIDGVEYPNRFLIHSGYSGTILFDDKFANKNGLGEKLPTLSESELKDSYGNVLTSKKAEMPDFKLGKTSFSDFPVAFFEGAIGKQKISVMGADLLKRFNLIIDLQSAYLYLKPNELMDLPFSDI